MAIIWIITTTLILTNNQITEITTTIPILTISQMTELTLTIIEVTEIAAH